MKWFTLTVLVITGFVVFLNHGHEVVVQSEVQITESQSAGVVSLKEKVGRLMMVGVPGSTVGSQMQAFLEVVQPGGVVLFSNDLGVGSSNITSKEQVTELIADIKRTVPGTLIAVDAEGGAVNRLSPEYGFTNAMPSAAWLGTQSTSTTYTYAERLATELAVVGFDLNFAPVVDVAVNPENPVIAALGRSYSADPETVTAHTAAFAKAHQEVGVHVTLKHFPGHGSSLDDSHLGFTAVTDTYNRAIELQPYRDLFAAGYDDFVMTAHITHEQFGDVPTTLSKVVLTDMLRDELGFTGVVITDDLQMGAIIDQYGEAEAAVMALQAGADMVLLANQTADYQYADTIAVRDAIVAAVETGVLSIERIDEAYGRVTAVGS